MVSHVAFAQDNISEFRVPLCEGVHTRSGRFVVTFRVSKATIFKALTFSLNHLLKKVQDKMPQEIAIIQTRPAKVGNAANRMDVIPPAIGTSNGEQSLPRNGL